MNQVSPQRPQLAQPGQQVAPRKPIDVIRHDLDKMSREFSFALPQHIPVDRFKRIVLTAINQNADLLIADKKSLFGACMKAAQDGLYPDGREGALVIFNTKEKDEGGRERWIKKVQWMPMVYGIIKKMRNSGELASIVAHEVYEKDSFRYTLGDEEKIEHEPFMGDGDPGKMKAVYAIAKLKDGTIQREVMTRAQVEKVRNVSKTKDSGPWASWYEEMARKTVVRRLSKYLPMSTEIEELLRRDDALSASSDTIRYDGEDPTGELIEGEAEVITEPGAIEHQAEQTMTAQTTTSRQKEAVPAEQRQAKPKQQAKAQPQPQPEPEYDAETGEIHETTLAEELGEPNNLFGDE